MICRDFAPSKFGDVVYNNYLCNVKSNEKTTTSKSIGILIKILMKCRDQHSCQWRAPTDRCSSGNRGITKARMPSNPVFIGVSSHPLMWLLITEPTVSKPRALSLLYYAPHPAPYHSKCRMNHIFRVVNCFQICIFALSIAT